MDEAEGLKNSETRSLKIIDKDKTLSLIDFPDLIQSAEEAFVAQSEGHASTPAYINMEIGENFAHYKAGYRKGSDYFTVKYSGGFWGNAEKGLPVDYGFVVVHSSKTGKPEVMFLDEGTITDYRTAAAGAVASKYASREDSEVVGVIGTGEQARLQVEALTHVRTNLKKIKVWGRNLEHAQKYANEMRVKLPQLEFEICTDPEQAVRNSDILITTTPSRTPIVKADWITPGTHITAVGACAPYMQEHEPEVITRANRVYADSIEKCLVDGELHHAIEKGIIAREQITGELGQLISGKISGRQDSSEITFVDLVGLGIQDATAAEHLLRKL